MIWIRMFFKAQSSDLLEILKEINDMVSLFFKAQSADLLEILLEEINDLSGSACFLKLNQPTCWKYSRKSMIWNILFFKAQSADLLEFLEKITDLGQPVF